MNNLNLIKQLAKVTSQRNQLLDLMRQACESWDFLCLDGNSHESIDDNLYYRMERLIHQIEKEKERSVCKNSGKIS